MKDLKESSSSDSSSGSSEPSSWQIFTHHTTLHGLRFIFAYGPITVRRLLWAAAFLASLGLLVLESAERLAYYFSHPHVMCVDSFASSSLVFPVVTLCNINPYRFSQLSRNDLYHAGELLALLDVHLNIPDPHLAEAEVLEVLSERANFTGYKPKPFSMQEFTERVGHDLKDMMLYCRYRGQECRHSDFSTVSLHNFLDIAGWVLLSAVARANTASCWQITDAWHWLSVGSTNLGTFILL
uniref:Uncharacterized protein n=1 Tax=Paramormyrops kingsleyae TaxID=1676925 RepID=A0A3B3Q4E4_9TELE